MSEGVQPADHAADSLSRGQLLKLGAAGAATVAGLGAFGPLVRRALAEAPETEIEALNVMLLFEHLELDLYERGLAKLEAQGEREASPLITQLIDEERRHRDTLIARIEELGGKPDPKGEYGFAYPNLYEFLRLAEEAELAGTWAYNGAIRRLESVESRELAASIVQVEGRHLVAIRLQREEEEPVPEALNRGVRELRARGSVLKFTGEL